MFPDKLLPGPVAARLEVHDFHNRVDVAVVVEHPSGRLLAKPVEFTEIGDDRVPAPTFTLKRAEAQALTDALGEEGFRSKQEAYRQKQADERLAAAERLIERLRNVAGAAMELAKP